MITLYFALLLIVPKAIGDGLRYKHPSWSFSFLFLWQAAIAIIIFAFADGTHFNREMDNYCYHLGGLILLRISIYDFIHNISGDLGWLYVGTTKKWDRAIQWLIDHKVPAGFIVFTRLCLLPWAIAWLLK